MCAMLVQCAMLEMNGVQCLYYVLCLKRMVCNACTMFYYCCYTCLRSNAESRTMIVEQSRTQRGSKHKYCLQFDIEINICTCIIPVL